MGGDRADDPWSPDSGASFERSPGFDLASVDSSNLAGPGPIVDDLDDLDDLAGDDDRRGRPAIAVAIVAASVVIVAATVVMLSSGGDEGSASLPDPPVATLPESLPAPERTLDEVRRDEAQRDTGADVVLGVGDVPLAAGDVTCPPERLPDSVDVRWSVAVGVAGEIVEELVATAGLAFVSSLVAEADGSTRADGSITALIALDEVDGRERWRTEIDGPDRRGLRVVDAVAGVVILESVTGSEAFVATSRDVTRRVVVGVSADSGDELWRAVVDPDAQVVIEPTGSRLIVHEPRGREDGGPPAVVAFDIVSGDRLWSHPGVLSSIGRDGSVAVIGENEIIWESERTFRFESIEAETRAAIVVGGSLIVVHGDGGPLTAFEREPDGAVRARPLEVAGVAGIDAPERLSVPVLPARTVVLGDSTFLLQTDGWTYGANISGDTVELRWRRAGEVVRSAPSDRGLLLEIEPNASDVHEVVESSTGRTVYRRSADEATPPGLHANGVTVTRVGSGDVAPVVRGLDLDGRERWTMPGASARAVGDRIVVVGSPDPDRAGAVTVTAFGPVADSAPRCGTVMREWVTS